MKGMGAEDRRPIGLTTHQDAGNSIPFPPTPWLDILHSHAVNQTLHLLAPSPTPPGLARDPILPPQAQHLAEIATYLSHLNALKLIEESDQEGLILEDDVDFEFFFKDMWSGIHRFIPNGWETVFLGSCGERENEGTFPSSNDEETDVEQKHPICTRTSVAPQRRTAPTPIPSPPSPLPCCCTSSLNPGPPSKRR